MSLIVRKEEFISLVFSLELQCCPLSEVVCFRLSCSFQGQGQCLCANSSYLGQNVFYFVHSWITVTSNFMFVMSKMLFQWNLIKKRDKMYLEPLSNINLTQAVLVQTFQTGQCLKTQFHCIFPGFTELSSVINSLFPLCKLF